MEYQNTLYNDAAREILYLVILVLRIIWIHIIIYLYLYFEKIKKI